MFRFQQTTFPDADEHNAQWFSHYSHTINLSPQKLNIFFNRLLRLSGYEK